MVQFNSPEKHIIKVSQTQTLKKTQQLLTGREPCWESQRHWAFDQALSHLSTLASLCVFVCCFKLAREAEKGDRKIFCYRNDEWVILLGQRYWHTIWHNSNHSIHTHTCNPGTHPSTYLSKGCTQSHSTDWTNSEHFKATVTFCNLYASNFQLPDRYLK